MSWSNIIRHPRIDDEPVMISSRQPDSPGRVDENRPDLASLRELGDEWAPDPLSVREEAVRQREAVLDQLESELAERKSELESTVRQFAEFVRNARFETAALAKEAERQAVELSLAIARRVVRAELHTHRDVVVRVVEEALDAAGR